MIEDLFEKIQSGEYDFVSEEMERPKRPSIGSRPTAEQARKYAEEMDIFEVQDARWKALIDRQNDGLEIMHGKFKLDAINLIFGEQAQRWPKLIEMIYDQTIAFPISRDDLIYFAQKLEDARVYVDAANADYQELIQNKYAT